MITPEQMQTVMPFAETRIPIYLQPLIDSMEEFNIATARRRSCFLAQVAHESGELRYMAELSSGVQYEMRSDLGNTESGDGPKYKGRGLLQATGRAMYVQLARALGIDVINQPELLEQPIPACRSAAWIWSTVKGCNDLADKDLFGSITHRINGGYLGLDSRISYWIRARKVEGL